MKHPVATCTVLKQDEKGITSEVNALVMPDYESIQELFAMMLSKFLLTDIKRKDQIKYQDIQFHSLCTKRMFIDAIGLYGYFIIGLSHEINEEINRLLGMMFDYCMTFIPDPKIGFEQFKKELELSSDKIKEYLRSFMEDK